MGRADGVISRLNAALRRVGSPPRTVYKRVVTRSGDTLIGRVSTSYVDTVFDPQPLVSRIDSAKLDQSALLSGNKVLQLEDQLALFSPTAITKTELESESTVIVMKDSAGNTETFRIVDYDFAYLEATVLMYVVVLRSVSR